MIACAPLSPARQVPVIDLSGIRATDEAVREQAAKRVAGEILARG